MSGAAQADAGRPSAGGVLAIGLGLLVIAAAIFGLLRKDDTALDGAARVGEWFGLEGELPLGLELRAANRLPFGTEVVRMSCAPSTDARPAPTPAEIFLLHYPLRAANDEIAKLFDEPKDDFGGEGPNREGPGAGHGEGDAGPGDAGFRDWGQLDWFEYRAPYVLVRKRSKGGATFTDSLRVNLSQPGFACVLIAVWEPDVEGGQAYVSELLTKLAPRS